MGFSRDGYLHFTLVSPQPEIVARTLSPVTVVLIGMGAIEAPNIISVTVFNKEMSFTCVTTLKSGWRKIDSTGYRAPGAVRLIVPAMIFMPEGVRSVVQCPAVTTQRLLWIQPPQKWMFAKLRRETCQGNCPLTALLPPIINGWTSRSIVKGVMMWKVKWFINYSDCLTGSRRKAQ